MWHKLHFVLQSKNLTMSNTPILYRVGLEADWASIPPLPVPFMEMVA